MQSFGPPRATTNPYIHMLDEALSHEPDIEHVHFDHKLALVGSYDVLHFHWPETLLVGRTPMRRCARRLYASALLLRLRLMGTKVVRTVHNVQLPTGLSRWEHWFLQGVEDQTAYRIALNEFTTVPEQQWSCVIAHGHYIDWFADVARVDPRGDALGFVGLIRQYKGVEHLMGVFHQTRLALPGTVLRIAGNPTSDSMRDEVQRLAGVDDRVELDLRYLSEEDFATSIMRVRGVVLPYRFMHNSGAVLAVLSLRRPVLIPDNAPNRALSQEVGRGWIHVFQDDLTASDLIDFHDALATPPARLPNLSARDWSDAGRLHARAYFAASSRYA